MGTHMTTDPPVAIIDPVTEAKQRLALSVIVHDINANAPYLKDLEPWQLDVFRQAHAELVRRTLGAESELMAGTVNELRAMATRLTEVKLIELALKLAALDASSKLHRIADVVNECLPLYDLSNRVE
jgi:hypothetical protein